MNKYKKPENRTLQHFKLCWKSYKVLLEISDGLFSKRESHETNFSLALCITNSKSFNFLCKNFSLRSAKSLKKNIDAETKANNINNTSELIDGTNVLKSA